MTKPIPKYFQNDPCHTFYNLESFSTFALTTDVDWAPDFATEAVFKIVQEAGFSMTCFATHKSALLADVPNWIEVGLHPDNTRPHKTLGLTNKIADLKEMYPGAVGLRCHRNFFGQNIAEFAVKAGLIYDVSVFQWRAPYCSVHVDQFGLTRMSYSWEDGVHCDLGLDWSLDHVPTASPGLKIFNVHPILVYLNCPDDNYRRNVTSGYSDLTTATEAELKPRIYQGYGVQTYFREMLQMLQGSGARSYTLSEVAAAVSEKTA